MNLRRITLPFLLLFLFFGTSHAQDQSKKDLKKLDRQGQKQIDNQEWIEAVETYSTLIKESPNDQEYNFLMGLATYKSGIKKDKAEVYLEKVSDQTIPEKNYFYGQVLLYNGKFDEAVKAFNAFKPLIGTDEEGEVLMAEINNYITHAENAKKMIKSPNSKLRVDMLNRGVNTEKSEYAPVIYQDEGVLVFTAMNFGYEEVREIGHGKDVHEEIYITEYELLDDKWTVRFKPNGDYLTPQVNSPDHNSSGLLFTDNNSKFYFYRDADIWISENKGAPQRQNVEIGNLSVDEMTAITTNAAGTHRFMVSDVLPRGKGGLDIYVSVKEGAKWSNWTPVENINTEFDEDSPYMDEDGTLYFSSNGPGSMGGHDIFKAEKTGKASWGDPVNLGVPINSTGHDIHFMPADDKGEVFFMASDRRGSIGNTDIYRVWTCHEIENTTVKGKLLAEGSAPQANIVVLDEEGNKVTTGEYDSKSGNFSYTVPTGGSYALVVVAENYLNDTARFNVPGQCFDYSSYQKIELALVKDENGVATAQTTSVTNAFYNIDKYRGDKSKDDFIAGLPEGHRLKVEPVVTTVELEGSALLAAGQFKDVRFGFDSDKLDGTAETIIDKVTKFMNENNDVKVILEGHTDTKGPAWYNKGLSKRRAKSVAKAITAKGVSNDRIEIRFYGEERPVVEDHDAEGNYIEDAAAQNRRVEIEFILPETK